MLSFIFIQSQSKYHFILSIFFLQFSIFIFYKMVLLWKLPYFNFFVWHAIDRLLGIWIFFSIVPILLVRFFHVLSYCSFVKIDDLQNTRMHKIEHNTQQQQRSTITTKFMWNRPKILYIWESFNLFWHAYKHPWYTSSFGIFILSMVDLL